MTKAKVTIGDSVYYIKYATELKEQIMSEVDSFEDHEHRDWYFINKQYNIIKVESLEDIENIRWNF